MSARQSSMPLLNAQR